jgi:ATP adenylyltransferase
MEQVFAPWRIEWIERENKNAEIQGCVFCELPDFGADREYYVVARNDRAFVMLNNYPYNPGHVMVIPRQHSGDFRELNEEVLLDHARLKQRTFGALETGMNPDGFNAGMNLGDGAGGSVDDHLHTHVVPRWEGDSNFMPVISETKVIVEALEDTYDRLHEAFAAQDGTTVSESGAVVIESD